MKLEKLVSPGGQVRRTISRRRVTVVLGVLGGVFGNPAITLGQQSPGADGFFAGVTSRLGAPTDAFGSCFGPDLTGEIHAGVRRGSMSLTLSYGRSTKALPRTCTGVFPGPAGRQSGTVEYARRGEGIAGYPHESVGLRLGVDRRLALGRTLHAFGGVEWIPSKRTLGPAAGTGFSLVLRERLSFRAEAEARVLRIPYEAQVVEYRDWEVVSDTLVAAPEWQVHTGLRLGLHVAVR